MLRGKQGRFRQNLLGKRVDYSGRIGYSCRTRTFTNPVRLPKEMALEMFKPFVLRELIVRGIAPNVKNAKNVLEKRAPEVFDIFGGNNQKPPGVIESCPHSAQIRYSGFFPDSYRRISNSYSPLCMRRI